jgi:hypothetical protein
MNRRGVTRLAVTPLAVNQAVVGAWAVLAPRSFFDQFPVGRGWVASLPPFNEHLTRDVGGLSLGFAVLFTLVLVDPAPSLARPALVAWLVPATTHLAFHLDHLQGFSGVDAVAQSSGLVMAVVLPAAVLWMIHPQEVHNRDRTASPARAPGRRHAS